MYRLEEAQARDRVKECKVRTRRLIQKGAIAAGGADDGTVCVGGLPDAEAAAARLNPLGGLRETGGIPLFLPEGTDYDTADRLYFEPRFPEDVMHIIEVEKPVDVVAALWRPDGHQAHQIPG